MSDNLFPELFYEHHLTKVTYSYQPQGRMNVHRLLNQKPYWETKKLESILKPKTLILADWTLDLCNDNRFLKILNFLQTLLSQQFEIYVWQEHYFIKLENPALLDDSYQINFDSIFLCDIRKRITPSISEIIIKKAVDELSIPKDHLFVLQSHHLDQFCGISTTYKLNIHDLNQHVLKQNNSQVFEFFEHEKTKITGFYKAPYESFCASIPKIMDCHADYPIDEYYISYQSCPEYLFINDLSDENDDVSTLRKIKFLKIITPEENSLENWEIFKDKILECRALEALNIYYYLDTAIELFPSILPLIYQNYQTLTLLNIVDHFLNAIDIQQLPHQFDSLSQLIVNCMDEKLNFNILKNLMDRMPQLKHCYFLDLNQFSEVIDFSDLITLKIKYWKYGDEWPENSQLNLSQSLQQATKLKSFSLTLPVFKIHQNQIWTENIHLPELKCLSLNIEKTKEDDDFYPIALEKLICPLIENSRDFKALHCKNIYFQNFNLHEQQTLSKIPELNFAACILPMISGMAFSQLTQLNLINCRAIRMQNCQFPELTHLFINKTEISHDTLIQILKSAPKLQWLFLQGMEYEINAELAALLTKIPHFKLIKLDNEEALKLNSTTTSKAKSFYSRTPSMSLDSETIESPSNTLHAHIIFKNELGENVDPCHYRLNIFDELNIDSIENILTRPENDEQIFDTKYEHFSKFTSADFRNYQGFVKLELSSYWTPLPSLSPSDDLKQILFYTHIDDIEVRYSSRYHQYFIRAKKLSKPLLIQCKFDIISSSAIYNFQQGLPLEIQQIILKLSDFRSGKLQGPQKTALELLDSLEKEQVGACRHRAILFKKLIESSGFYCRVIVNDVHAFAEICYQNTWYSIDLGGFEAHIKHHEPKLDITTQQIMDLKIQLNRDLEKLYNDYLYLQNQWLFNIQILTNIQETYQLKVQEIHFYYGQQIQILTHQQFSDDTKETLQPSVNDELKTFLTQTHESECLNQESLIEYLKTHLEDHKILIQTKKTLALKQICYIQERFLEQGYQVYVAHSPDDLMGGSGYLEKRVDGFGETKAQGGPLYDFLMNQHPQKLLLIDYTRFKTDEILRFSHSLYDKTPMVDGLYVPLHLKIIGVFDPHAKNAYTGDDFLERFNHRIIAPATDSLPDYGFSFFTDEKSAMPQQIIELSCSGQWSSKLFGDWEIHHGRPFFNTSNCPALTDSSIIILNNPPLQDQDFLSFCAQLIVQKKFNHQQMFFTEEIHWEQVIIQPLTAFSNQTKILNQQTHGQFIKSFESTSHGLHQIPGYVTQHARNILEIFVNSEIDTMLFDEIFQLAITHQVTIHMAFAPHVPIDEFFTDKVNILTCQDWENRIHVVNDVDLYLSLEKTKDYAHVIFVDDLNFDDLFFRYVSHFQNDHIEMQQQVQDLYRFLEQGQTVVLTGHFSQTLILELSAFMFQERHNPMFNQLKLLRHENIPGFKAHTVELDQEPKIRKPTERLSFDDKTTFEDAQSFNAHRKYLIDTQLQHAPFVFIAGLTSVGKSQFIDKEYQAHQLFKEVEQLELWAKAIPQVYQMVILFIDEANMQDSNWMGFEGMFHTNPFVFFSGHYYRLTPLHKVIFAGNPENYGDDRQTPTLLKRHDLCVTFEPLSPTFIYQKVICELFDAYHARICGPVILEMYQHLVALSKNVLLVTPRQVETICLLIQQDLPAWRMHEDHIQEICRFYCHEVFKGCLNPKDYERFCKEFPAVERPFCPRSINIPEKTFIMTHSRQKIIEMLLDFLAMNHGKGMKRLVLEGDPGVGKTELLLTVLKIWNPEASGYIYMPASMSITEKKTLLYKAFDEGLVIFTDEINSSVFFEQLLNNLLDNKHPEEGGRPAKKLGFKLIGTQNGMQLSGRQKESPALKSRTLYIQVPAYTAQEVWQLAISRGLSLEKAYDLKIAYEILKPSFRRVLQWIDSQKSSIPQLSQNSIFPEQEKQFLRELLMDLGP